MEFHYQLEKRKNTGKAQTKFECPDCGHKSFVLYIDHDGEYLSEDVGKCDRSNNCTFHKSPTEYLIENKLPFPWIPSEDWIGYDGDKPRWLSDQDKQKGYTVEKLRQIIGIEYTTIKRIKPKVIHKPRPELKPLTIEKKYLELSQRDPNNNNFIKFLRSNFNYNDVSNMCNRFFVGTSTVLPGGVIFWQRDQHGRIRTGKIMLYDPITGHRIKEGKKEAWIHNYGEYRNHREGGYEVIQCLFGLHQSNDFPHKSIGIVESEKTAILCSHVIPNIMWMATGCDGNLKAEFLKHLIGRKIILYPDKGVVYNKWKDKIAENHIRELNLDISISDVLENSLLLEGSDVVDLFEAKEKSILEQMKDKNPNLQTMIDKFDLIEINK